MRIITSTLLLHELREISEAPFVNLVKAVDDIDMGVFAIDDDGFSYHSLNKWQVLEAKWRAL